MRFAAAVLALVAIVVFTPSAEAKKRVDPTAADIQVIARLASTDESGCIKTISEADVISVWACWDPKWTLSATTMVVVEGSPRLCPLYIRGAHGRNLRYECANGAEATDESIRQAAAQAIHATALLARAELKRQRRNR